MSTKMQTYTKIVILCITVIIIVGYVVYLRAQFAQEKTTESNASINAKVLSNTPIKQDQKDFENVQPIEGNAPEASIPSQQAIPSATNEEQITAPQKPADQKTPAEVNDAQIPDPAIQADDVWWNIWQD